VIDDGRGQDAQDDGQRLFEARCQDEGQKLGFVANFCQRDNARGDEERFHGI
jgi:hypothetical protein